MKLLKAESFLWLAVEEEVREIQAQEELGALLLASRRREPHDKEGVWLLEAVSGPSSQLAGKWGPQFHNHKEMDSANNMDEIGK